MLACIKYLASQNLALHGHEERLSNDCDNPGNFLSLLKLIGLIISEHLKYARDNPKSVTYLSPEIQRNEFISTLANSVRNRLVQDIIQSKYYMVGELPDGWEQRTEQSLLGVVVGGCGYEWMVIVGCGYGWMVIGRCGYEWMGSLVGVVMSGWPLLGVVMSGWPLFGVVMSGCVIMSGWPLLGVVMGGWVDGHCRVWL